MRFLMRKKLGGVVGMINRTFPIVDSNNLHENDIRSEGRLYSIISDIRETKAALRVSATLYDDSSAMHVHVSNLRAIMFAYQEAEKILLIQEEGRMEENYITYIQYTMNDFMEIHTVITAIYGKKDTRPEITAELAETLQFQETREMYELRNP